MSSGQGMVDPRRTLRFLAIAVVWFALAAVAIVRPGTPGIVKLLAVFPVGTAIWFVADLLLPLYGRLASFVEYVAVASNALFWASVLVALRWVFWRLPLRLLFALAALAWWPAAAYLIGMASSAGELAPVPVVLAFPTLPPLEAIARSATTMEARGVPFWSDGGQLAMVVFVVTNALVWAAIVVLPLALLRRLSALRPAHAEMGVE